MGARIYIYDTRSLPDMWERLATNLPRHYRAKALGNAPEQDRKLSLCAGLLLKGILGIESDEQIHRTAYGKPSLRDSPLKISLSHGGCVAVLAISDEAEVGVDAEMIEPLMSASAWAAARGVFGEGYCEELRRLERDGAFPRGGDSPRPGHSPAAIAFALKWTEAEAVLKAEGTGFGDDARAPFETSGTWHVWSRILGEHAISCASRHRSVMEPQLLSVRFAESAAGGAFAVQPIEQEGLRP